MSAVDPLAHIVEGLCRSGYDDLDPATIARAKVFLLDSLGVAIAGRRDPLLANLAAAASGWGQGGEATLWATGARLPAPSAALVNAYQIHCLEFDCVHEGAVVHAFAANLAALLAQAERRSRAGRPLDGRGLLTALAVGVEVAALLGLSATGPMRFFRPAVAGGFGAAAALAQVEGLDPARARSLLGLYHSQAGGTLQAHLEASPALALQMGFAARNALAALDLAAAGVDGPRDVLLGRYGYFALFEDGAFEIGEAWDAAAPGQIARMSHKPFPSGRLTHGAIGALLELRRDAGLAADEVTRVEVAVPPLVQRLVGRPDVPEPGAGYARLCLPFVGAVALLKGRVDVADFDPEALADPQVHALAQRIVVTPDGNPDENALVPQAVRIELNDGRRLAAAVEQLPGHLDRPLSQEAHLAKFARCCESANADRAAALVALVEDLEALDDVAELVTFLRPRDGVSAQS